MGKASKWLRGLLGLKRPDSPSPTAPKEKRRWSFVKSYREKDLHPTHNHDMAVAAATAAVAEAAVAAAHAAAAVARLTCTGRCPAATAGAILPDEWAAIKIQAAFRGSLARKALRALKGLVKLQALVRGQLERKHLAERMQRVQALLRVQARIRAGRAQLLQSPDWNAKSSSLHLHSPATPDKFESPIRSQSMKYDHLSSSSSFKRNSSKSRINGNQMRCGNGSDCMIDEQSGNQRKSWTRTWGMDEESCVRILEIDSGKPHITPKLKNPLYSTKDSTSYQSGQSACSCEVQSYSYSPMKTNEVEESSLFCGGDNSPQTLSASSSKDDCSKRSPFTPTRSDGSRSYASACSDYPSYMAYTESSKAKVRSLSVPKQRPQYERSSSSKGYLLHGFGDSKLATQRVSALHASFTTKAYPGSGRLDKLGFT
ncbi:hypothetical protein RJT34_05380 [Clitoria ternatea]|uniref:DUF4005 domain-containing protein n=1 Tax=Clitoria ternatea TaxID=43366 RepID=A0AAN9K225_CLITE